MNNKSPSTPWTKKYEPKNSSEIIGQDSAVKAIKEYIANFKSGKTKAIVLYGPPGCGKTSSVYAVARDLDLELIEVNASDFRNKNMINATIGNASQQMSLFMKQKVILVDEIDGLSGQKDRGGVAEITRLIEQTKFPMILTAQNPYDKKFKGLRKKSDLVQFNSLDYKNIHLVLENICKNENINTDENALKGLALRSGGDLRGAIVDLQILSAGTNNISKDMLDELSGRKQTESMLQALVKIFKTTDPSIAIKALDNVDENLDQSFLWIDENLPKEYKKPKDLAKAYLALSKADVYRGRIRRWQHWRFLVYVNTLLTAGIATAKDEKYKEFVQYKPTMRLLRIWQAKMSNAKKKSISQKIAAKTHTSAKEVMNDFGTYRAMFMQTNLCNDLAEYFEIDKEELKWMRK